MNAYCTIAAAQSEDNTGGIFRSLPSKEYSKAEFECTSAKGERKKVLAFKATPMRWRSMLENFPLNKRTWVFVELELSPRVLYFTGSQVLWECETLRARAYGNVIHLKDSSGTKSYGQMSFDVLTERGDLKIVGCVYLFKQNGMAILPVEGRDGYYRRVGAITGILLEHFQNKEWVEITLI